MQDQSGINDVSKTTTTTTRVKYIQREVPELCMCPNATNGLHIEYMVAMMEDDIDK